MEPRSTALAHLNYSVTCPGVERSSSRPEGQRPPKHCRTSMSRNQFDIFSLDVSLCSILYIGTCVPLAKYRCECSLNAVTDEEASNGCGRSRDNALTRCMVHIHKQRPQVEVSVHSGTTTVRNPIYTCSIPAQYLLITVITLSRITHSPQTEPSTASIS
jgi:hypothetical protein